MPGCRRDRRYTVYSPHIPFIARAVTSSWGHPFVFLRPEKWPRFYTASSQAIPLSTKQQAVEVYVELHKHLHASPSPFSMTRVPSRNSPLPPILGCELFFPPTINAVMARQSGLGKTGSNLYRCAVGESGSVHLHILSEVPQDA